MEKRGSRVNYLLEIIWYERSEVKSSKNSRGFTLIELLVGLAIFSIIITAVYATFRSGVIAWQRGEENISDNQEARLALERISSDIRNAAHFGKRRFEGKPEGLRFIMLDSERGCLCEINYLYDKNNLLRKKSPLLWKEDSTDLETMAKPNRVIFQYLSKEANSSGDWRDSWDSTQLPEAIRITLEIRGKAFITIVRTSI